MTDSSDLASIARAIIDTNLYMVLGTADEDGRPWASPVYYAPAAYREFLWVSRPEARHSRNLEVRPQLCIVIFDSSVAIGCGRGVYISAVAEQLVGTDAEEAVELFSRRSLAHGGHAWTPSDVEPPAQLRLFRATAEKIDALDENDRRVPVTL
jgi:nitroimidazol reductase NimA-like FMN-containing flavoprotein (pyridoxamine 5'-phosphate oxidase superfamily)